MLDIHSHILPNMDDGASSMKVAFEMMKLAEIEGIKKVIATPHYSTKYYENHFDAVVKKIEEIRALVEEGNIDIELLPGQEVLLEYSVLANVKRGCIKGLNYSRYLLTELPMERRYEKDLDILHELRMLGFIPIIAHPERYLYIVKQPDLLNDFINEDCLFQLNASSITGKRGKKIQSTATLLIQHGFCDFVATDAHSNKRRIPVMKAAIETADTLNHDFMQQLNSNWGLLLQNQNIEQNREKIRRKRFFFFVDTFTKYINRSEGNEWI